VLVVMMSRMLMFGSTLSLSQKGRLSLRLKEKGRIGGHVYLSDVWSSVGAGGSRWMSVLLDVNADGN